WVGIRKPPAATARPSPWRRTRDKPISCSASSWASSANRRKLSRNFAPPSASCRTWLNLGISLYQQQKNEEARAYFAEVLQRSPTNALAIKYMQKLQQGNHE